MTLALDVFLYYLWRMDTPAAYCTLPVIAKRLGVHPNVLQYLRRDFGFPMFRLKRNQWATTEAAILAWQWHRAQLDREYLKLEKAWRAVDSKGFAYSAARYRAVMRRFHQLSRQAQRG